MPVPVALAVPEKPRSIDFALRHPVIATVRKR
jgi:hypothetical protein